MAGQGASEDDAAARRGASIGPAPDWPPPEDLPRLRAALAAWFDGVARDLPWRRDRTPYRTWLSEVMLQQTRVEQAIPYFERFTERFPTVNSLADAPLDEVLRLWEGLGYYARARNLHRAARLVAYELSGEFPATLDGLRALPGVGAYTAAAMASQAYGLAHAALDGNVIRVLARLTVEPEPPRRAAGRRRLERVAQALLDPDRPGAHNEAMMELGARICTPARPDCAACPIAAWCRARAEGTPESWPVRMPRRAVPHHDVAVGVVRSAEGRILIQRRPEDAMLGGLWEFPGGKCEPGEAPADACRRELAEELGITVDVGRELARIDHAYSHFRVTLHAFDCRMAAGTPGSANGEPIRWVVAEELGSYAFPRANRRLIERLAAEGNPGADGLVAPRPG